MKMSHYVPNVKYTHQPTVRCVSHTGGDASVLAAMLVSTQGAKSLKALTEDPEAGEGRIRFLMKNKHGSPFEHNQFRFYVKAPIFVFREFHRHRIGWSYNEESGRYKKLAPSFYVPAYDRPLIQTGKPGAYIMEPADQQTQYYTHQLMYEAYEAAAEKYEQLLGLGIAKEVARAVLPVGLNSSMYATCNARSLMAFLSLRTDEPSATFPSKPQYEIEQVARKMEAVFAKKMPITYKCWNDNGRVAP